MGAGRRDLSECHPSCDGILFPRWFCAAVDGALIGFACEKNLGGHRFCEGLVLQQRLLEKLWLLV
jgi:hypothetical protein